MKTTHVMLAAMALLLGGLALPACTGKNEPGETGMTSAGATARPTVSAPSDPVHTSREEARNAYVNYVEVRNAVRQDYYRDWDSKYLPLAVGDEMKLIETRASARAAQGYRQIGAAVVTTTPEIVTYDDTDSRGNYRAEMRACVDTSDVEFVADGRVSSRATPSGRFYFEIRMQRVVGRDSSGAVEHDKFGQGWWRVASEHGDPEQPC